MASPKQRQRRRMLRALLRIIDRQAHYVTTAKADHGANWRRAAADHMAADLADAWLASQRQPTYAEEASRSGIFWRHHLEEVKHWREHVTRHIAQGLGMPAHLFFE